MSKRDVLLAILNSSELKNLANNAKIRSSLKFLLIRYSYNLGLFVHEIQKIKEMMNTSIQLCVITDCVAGMRRFRCNDGVELQIAIW